jgi:hypothetical protein
MHPEFVLVCRAVIHVLSLRTFSAPINRCFPAHLCSVTAIMFASRLDIVLSQLLGRVLSSSYHRYCGPSPTWACICLYAHASSAFWLSCDPRWSSVLSLALIEEFPVPGSLVREPQLGGSLHSRLALCERLIRPRGRQKAYSSCWKLCSKHFLSLADITIPPLMEATEGHVASSYYSPRLGTRAFVFFINFLLTHIGEQIFLTTLAYRLDHLNP